jgi:hypothetical protein
VKKWTGVGSQKTPESVCMVETLFAQTKPNSIMRSGAAKGSDKAFEDGAKHTEIYLPDRGFRGHQTGIWQYTEEQAMWGEYLAQKVYPIVIQNKQHMKMFRRNAFQVVGLSTCVEDSDPSEFLVCWTPDGCVSPSGYLRGRTGGTGVAIMIAWEFDIPIYNLRNKPDMKKVLARIDRYGTDINPIKQRLMREGLYG